MPSLWGKTLPLRNFIIAPEFQAPGLPEVVSLEDAPRIFEEAGIMPQEAVQAMIDSESVEHEEHTLISPSKLIASHTCRREVLIKHFLPYDADPFALWAALEGTLWHAAFAHAGKKLDGWLRELSLPRPVDIEKLGGKLARVEGVLAIEVLPGLFMRGTLDRLSLDYRELGDHKTQKYSKTDYADQSKFGPGDAENWRVQLSVYAFMVEDVFGVKPDRAFVWRTYRGSLDRARTFRKIPITLLSREQVLERVGEFAYSLRDILAQAQSIRAKAHAAGLDPTPELEALARATPMDGYEKQQFNGKKCPLYCVARKVCFGLAGIPEF